LTNAREHAIIFLWKDYRGFFYRVLNPGRTANLSMRRTKSGVLILKEEL